MVNVLTQRPAMDCLNEWPQRESGDVGAVYNAMVWHVVPHLFHLAASLGLADHLGPEPKTAVELAKACGAHHAPLELALAALTTVGYCERHGDGWVLAGRGAVSRVGDDSGVHEALLALAEPWHWAHFALWASLEQTVRTGVPAFEATHGQSLFDAMAQDAGLRRSFQRFMNDRSAYSVRAIEQALDLSNRRVLVDVGAGHGALATACLDRYPDLTAVLFDRPEVVAECRSELTGYGDRLRVEEGDFLTAVPAGGDVYVLKEVLHNWSDEDATTILQRCCDVMESSGEVIVCESPAGQSGRAALVSMGMYLVFGGRQRSEDEFAQLFAAAGLRLDVVVATDHPTLRLVIGRRT